jgi:glycosyltransferase involved in cell wall biosynthesis
METVSVITVCLNEEPKEIKETINSIIAQDYKNIEIVIIDGGSKSNTLNAFKEYQKQIACMVSEPDKGIFDAMNSGILKATGEWIIFMNIGDKFYESHSLSRLMAGAKNDVDILYGNVMKNYLSMSPKKISKYLLYRKGICHQAILARRSLFQSIGLFDPAYKLCGDPEWIIRAFKKGVAFKYMNVVVAYYAGGGLSSNSEFRKPFWESVVRKHFSRTEIIAYWFKSVLERTYKRIIKLDFSIPASIKKYYHGNIKNLL